MKLFAYLAVFCFSGLGYSLNSAPISPDEVSDDQIRSPLSGVVQPSPNEDLALFQRWLWSLADLVRECDRRPGFYDYLANEPKPTRMSFCRVVGFVEGLHLISTEEASGMVNHVWAAHVRVMWRFEQTRERLAQEFERLSQKRQQVLEVSNESDTEE